MLESILVQFFLNSNFLITFEFLEFMYLELFCKIYELLILEN